MKCDYVHVLLSIYNYVPKLHLHFIICTCTPFYIQLRPQTPPPFYYMYMYSFLYTITSPNSTSILLYVHVLLSIYNYVPKLHLHFIICRWVGLLSSFFRSFYTLSASVLHTCIFMYTGVKLCLEYHI